MVGLLPIKMPPCCVHARMLAVRIRALECCLVCVDIMYKQAVTCVGWGLHQVSSCPCMMGLPRVQVGCPHRVTWVVLCVGRLML